MGFPDRSRLHRFCDAVDVCTANLSEVLQGDDLQMLNGIRTLVADLRSEAWGDDPFEAIGMPPLSVESDDALDDLMDTFMHGQCFNFAPVLAAWLKEHLSPADAEGIELVSILASRTDSDEDADPDSDEVFNCIHCFVKITRVNRETVPPADEIFYLDAEGVHDDEDGIVERKITAWQYQRIYRNEDVLQEPEVHEYDPTTNIQTYWFDLADSDAEQSDEWAAKALHLIQKRQDVYLKGLNAA